MPTVHIPAAMRAVTGERSTVAVPGGTLGEALDHLEAACPGIGARLLEHGRIRQGLAIFVDGMQVMTGLRTRLEETSEVYFIPAVSGG